MFEISYSDDNVTFVNTKTQKAEKLELFDAMVPLDAIRVVNNEIKGRESASKASVSLLAGLLDNARHDSYRGTCPINEMVPKELKQAVRDLETEVLKPIFSAPLIAKGSKPGTIETLWQDFAKGLREGGSYANTKSRVFAYFAHTGNLPIAANGKLITVAALDKILANEKERAGKPKTNEGIAGKLVVLSEAVENRKDNEALGDYVTAIAAMKSMLATYEGLYREALEVMTELKGNSALDIGNMAQSAIDTASQTSLETREKELTAAYEAGQMDEVPFVIAMADIGIDVEIETEENA